MKHHFQSLPERAFLILLRVIRMEGTGNFGEEAEQGGDGLVADSRVDLGE